MDKAKRNESLHEDQKVVWVRVCDAGKTNANQRKGATKALIKSAIKKGGEGR